MKPYLIWGFPKLGVPFWVPILRILVFGGLYWGPPILENYQFGWYKIPSIHGLRHTRLGAQAFSGKDLGAKNNSSFEVYEQIYMYIYITYMLGNIRHVWIKFRDQGMGVASTLRLGCHAGFQAQVTQTRL